MEATWAGASSIGRVRDVQEDSWGAVTLTGAAPGPAVTFAAVADGMGGADAGEIASRLAIRAATAAFCDAVSRTDDGSIDAASQAAAMAAAFRRPPKLWPATRTAIRTCGLWQAP